MSWRFLTNHGRALMCVAHDPNMRLRDIAAALEITERAAQKLMTDLVESGYVTRRRLGRRNVYDVHADAPLPMGRELKVRDMFSTFDRQAIESARQEAGYSSSMTVRPRSSTSGGAVSPRASSVSRMPKS